ncbi:MAG: ABC transporter permease subunit [Verrucomicrobiales bacterium]|nr:ABC transporter permease subunit [Verrucomicrobiales bacterium]
MKKLARGREGWLFILSVLLAWQILAVSLSGTARGYLLPTLTVTLAELWKALPELLRGTWASALILVPGYALAVAAGVAWGLLVGTTGWLWRAFVPFARAASPVPGTVYIPYAIAVLPTFKLSSIFLIFIGAFWPVFLNAAAGANTVAAGHRENAKILGLTKFQYLRLVALPAALPHIFNGMGVGLVLTFILLTVAEAFAVHSGLGYFIQTYADYANYPKMVAGILYVGLVTSLCMGALDRLRRRVIFWEKKV